MRISTARQQHETLSDLAQIAFVAPAATPRQGKDMPVALVDRQTGAAAEALSPARALQLQLEEAVIRSFAVTPGATPAPVAGRRDGWAHRIALLAAVLLPVAGAGFWLA